jgi:maltose O-acetyltransferase
MRARAALRTLTAEVRAASFHSVVNVVAGSSWLPKQLRRALYRALGFEIGGATLSPHLIFKTNRASIGLHAFINERCAFDNVERVTIGEGVHVGPEVLFGTTSHRIGRPDARAGPMLSAPVVVAPGCWIGARAMILPGVTIGEGCVVAAGAVVTRDCQPHGLYAGVPARRIRDLDPHGPGVTDAENLLQQLRPGERREYQQGWKLQEEP